MKTFLKLWATISGYFAGTVAALAAVFFSFAWLGKNHPIGCAVATFFLFTAVLSLLIYFDSEA